jgi:hypothetical protein
MYAVWNELMYNRLILALASGADSALTTPVSAEEEEEKKKNMCEKKGERFLNWLFSSY